MAVPFSCCLLAFTRYDRIVETLVGVKCMYRPIYYKWCTQTQSKHAKGADSLFYNAFKNDYVVKMC